MWQGYTGCVLGWRAVRWRIADTAGSGCKRPLWETQRVCVGPACFPWCDLNLERRNTPACWRRKFWRGAACSGVEGESRMLLQDSQRLYARSLKSGTSAQVDNFCFFAHWKLASWYFCFQFYASMIKNITTYVVLCFSDIHLSWLFWTDSSFLGDAFLMSSGMWAVGRWEQFPWLQLSWTQVIWARDWMTQFNLLCN